MNSATFRIHLSAIFSGLGTQRHAAFIIWALKRGPWDKDEAADNPRKSRIAAALPVQQPPTARTAEPYPMTNSA